MNYRRTEKPDIKKLWDDDVTKMQHMGNRKRSVVLITIIFIGFFAVYLQLINLMVIKHGALSQEAEQQYFRTVSLKPQRGLIWDRAGREMAVNVETSSLYAVPSRIRDIKKFSSCIAPFINVSAEKLGSRISALKEKDFMWLARKMDEETSRKIAALKNKQKNNKENLQEMDVVTETKRYYPKGQLAAHVIGYTDIDNKGLEGIESRYDRYVQGEGKKIMLGRDARGVNLANNAEESVPGNTLLLTIDEGLQYIVEREIENAMTKWNAEGAVAIMMNPMTGEILAMANRPTYDLNSPAEADASERRNRAITDFYEPGSTFKTILASAAIEEKTVTPDKKFDCSKGYIYAGGGKPIRDVHRNGVLTFKECVQKSSNVCLVQVGMLTGEEKYYKYIKKFGFGEKTGIDLYGEVSGLLRAPGAWSGRSLASMSIGQEIGVTPLQILRAYSAIANGGKLMRPYVVSEIISPSGSIVEKISPKVERQVVSEETARIMRDILKTVVEEGGTAQRASIKGNLVAGKTGTAQMIDPRTGRYSSTDYVSSFIGFVPADNPKIGLIVVVYKPRGARYGGTVAAPVFKNIIEHSLAYLDIPMERDENYVILVSKSR